MENSTKSALGFNTFIDTPPKEAGTYMAVLDNGVSSEFRYTPGEVVYPGKWELNGLNFTSRVICWRDCDSGEDRAEECFSTHEDDSET